MTLPELNHHFDHIRRMQNEIKALEDRIPYKSDNSDDAIYLRSSYETIQRQMKVLLAHEYDVEYEPSKIYP